MTSAEQFWKLFEGNATASYKYNPDDEPKYKVVNHGVTLDDIERHLAGRLPSVLSIPILPSGLTHFACGDCDRHNEADEAIDYVAVALRISELHLPLVITRSKSPKSAHVWLFFADVGGFSAAIARQLIEEYMKRLGITGDIEVFPKQDGPLEPGKRGSGINLPYFSDTRIAFRRDGEPLSLDEFLALAHECASFGNVLAERDLKDGPSGHRAASADEEDHPMLAATAKRIHTENLEALRTATHERNNTLNKVAFFAGRVFGAKVFDITEEGLKDPIRKAASTCGLNEAEIKATLESGWSKGILQPLKIKEDEAKAALKFLDDFLAVPSNVVPSYVPTLKEIAECCVRIEPEDLATRKKPLCKRMGISVKDLEAAVKSARARNRKEATGSGGNGMALEQVRESLHDLLLTTEKERAVLELPLSIEAASAEAEIILWNYITEIAQVFCTESGQGYLLLHDRKDIPIPVQHDGKELSAFLSALGIHPGAAARNRIGKFLGSQAYRHGIRCEPRITFHFDLVTFNGYFSEQPGKLIKITANQISRVDNGTDGQLFLVPDKYEPWTLDLENLPAPTDIGPDAFALLPELLFDILEFENESLCREDIEVLLGAYIATLYLPGIVAGKLLLEILGGTGSGKTMFARMLGRLVYGKQFEVTGLDGKPEQLENAVCANSFLVLDDVKMTTDPMVLGIIRRACTGGKVNRRELYSTFGQVTEPFRAAICLTCSEEPFVGSDEMSNRALVIRVASREDYIDENELLQRIDANRDALMAEMMVRLQSCIIAVKAQANFKPRVKMRMASFATFLLRTGRQFDWGVSADQILEAWQEEQEGAGLDDSIVETLGLWFQEPREKWANKKFTASELYKELIGVRWNYGLPRPWWQDKDASLVRSMRNAVHAYKRGFGFAFKARTSGHTAPLYWFSGPTAPETPIEPVREKIPF